MVEEIIAIREEGDKDNAIDNILIHQG